jgi:hypothetical protein
MLVTLEELNSSYWRHAGSGECGALRPPGGDWRRVPAIPAGLLAAADQHVRSMLETNVSGALVTEITDHGPAAY